MRTPSSTAFGRLKDLSSYRYIMRWEITGAKSLIADRLGRVFGGRDALPDPFIVEVQGSVVASEKLETVYKVSGVQDEFAIVVINKQYWLRLPGGTVAGPTAFQGSLDDINEAAGFWDGRVMKSGVPMSCAGGREAVNGVPTRRCQITGATIQQLASLFGADIDQGRVTNSSLDLWLHERDGYPVRVRIALQGVDEKGKEFRVKGDLDITDVNSPAIQIQPPT